MPRKSALAPEVVDKLVLLVKQNPFIYDPTRKDHKDVIKTDNAWKSIAEKMEKPDMDGKCINYTVL